MNKTTARFIADCYSSGRLGYNLGCVARGRKSLFGVLVEASVIELTKYVIFN